MFATSSTCAHTHMHVTEDDQATAGRGGKKKLPELEKAVEEQADEIMQNMDIKEEDILKACARAQAHSITIK